MPLSKTQLYLLSKTNPHLALLEFMKEIERRIPEMFMAYVNENLPKIIEGMRTEYDQKLINEATTEILANRKFKGERGEKGDNIKGDSGYTPEKGKDYFTEWEIKQFIESVQSQIIVPLPKNGRTPIAGLDYPSYDEVDKMVRLLAEKILRYDETVLTAKLISKLQTALLKIRSCKELPTSAIKGDICILEDTGEIYIYD